MKLTEAEMRMVFQIESTNQNAALNEIYMTWCYALNPATKETAERSKIGACRDEHEKIVFAEPSVSSVRVSLR